MLNIYNKYWILILLLASISCQNRKTVIPNDVITEIEFAGSNGKNLRDVLENYKSPEDSLKLKSAFYLIRNIRDQYYYKGKIVDDFNIFINKVDSIVNANTKLLEIKNDSAKAINPVYDEQESVKKFKRKVVDSLQKKYGNWNVSETRRIDDITTITSKLLVENIDLAFKAWNYPWCKSLTFTEFCEYILPYKVLNEEPTFWRKEMNRRFSGIIKQMKDSTDAREACYLINSQLKREFYLEGTYFKYPIDMNYEELDKIKMGKCSDANHYAEYAMRAMGVPVVSDYTPYWANRNKGHDWLVLKYKYNNQSFVGCESDPGLDKIFYAGRRELQRKLAKVFRYTYPNQHDDFDFSEEIEKIPSIFVKKHYKDVTPDYASVTNVTIPIKKIEDIAEVNFAYLHIFNNNKWRPIACAKVVNGKIHFNNIGLDIVYLVGSYKFGELQPLAAPFELKKDGQVCFLDCCDKTKDNATLFKKYPEDKTNKIIRGDHYELFYWEHNWVSLGLQLATCDSLIFQHCPKQALLILRDKDKGEQERIFTMENNKQRWW